MTASCLSASRLPTFCAIGPNRCFYCATIFFPRNCCPLQLQEKFRLDIDDEAADQVFLRLVDESVAAFFPAFFEYIHKIRVAMR